MPETSEKPSGGTFADEQETRSMSDAVKKETAIRIADRIMSQKILR